MNRPQDSPWVAINSLGIGLHKTWNEILNFVLYMKRNWIRKLIWRKSDTKIKTEFDSLILALDGMVERGVEMLPKSKGKERQMLKQLVSALREVQAAAIYEQSLVQDYQKGKLSKKDFKDFDSNLTILYEKSVKPALSVAGNYIEATKD